MKGSYLIISYLTRVFPLVKKRLKSWKGLIQNCSNKKLKHQALKSIKDKEFHALGGSFYSLYNPRYLQQLISFIVSFQTISDYLDNLCDRTGVIDEDAFRLLHQSLLLAVQPKKKQFDYYHSYPLQKDGSYLQSLVSECQLQVQQFPSYPQVREEVLGLVSLYCDLQVYKHLPPEERERRLQDWFKSKNNPSGLNWWEYSAAAGSTLGVFSLMALATTRELTAEKVEETCSSYFPWICALHILLDYLIDLQEDSENGDLNFVACYRDLYQCQQRMLHLYQQSLLKAESLEKKIFHQTAINGLLALYLSDPKTKDRAIRKTVTSLLDKGGGKTRFLSHLCVFLRRTGFL